MRDLWTLSERLDRLERNSRRWNHLVCVGVAALALLVFPDLLLPGAAAPRPGQRGQEGATPGPENKLSDEIRTKRIVLLDEQGKTRAVMNAVGSGPVSLGLVDKDEKVRALLILEADGIPRLELRAPDETRRAVLSVLPNRSGLALYGEDGRGGAVLDVQGNGVASLGLTDRTEKTRAAFLVERDRAVSLTFFDSRQRVRAGVGVGRDGSPHLGARDDNGQVLWRAPEQTSRHSNCWLRSRRSHPASLCTAVRDRLA